MGIGSCMGTDFTARFREVIRTEDLFAMYSEENISPTKPNTVAVSTKVVNCYCSKPADVKILFTEKNYLRPFLMCNTCGYWKWMDEIYPVKSIKKSGCSSASIGNNHIRKTLTDATTDNENVVKMNEAIEDIKTLLDSMKLMLQQVQGTGADQKGFTDQLKNILCFVVVLFALVVVALK